MAIYQCLKQKHSHTRALLSVFTIIMALLLATCAFAETNENIHSSLNGNNKSVESAGYVRGSATNMGYTLPKYPGKDAITGIYRKNGADETVQIAILGLCRSYIFMNDEPMFVYTSDLEIFENVPKEHMLAYVTAGSHARLYKDTGFKGSVSLCDPGVILPVISIGDQYVQVQHKGKTGYLKRSSVQLSSPMEGIGRGVVVNGKQSVNIRLEPGIQSTKVIAVGSDTEVIVLSDKGNWYEVEYNGLHGYIRKDFLEIVEKGFGDLTERTASDNATTDHQELPDEESNVVFKDGRLSLSLLDISREDGTVKIKIRAKASDCVCYLFAFTATNLMEEDAMGATKKYVSTMNGRFWDTVTSEPVVMDYRWDENLAYDQPFIDTYADSMMYNYQTISCTLSDDQFAQPVGFTVIEARNELDMVRLTEGKIEIDSVSGDIIQAFHLYISPQQQ